MRSSFGRNQLLKTSAHPAKPFPRTDLLFSLSRKLRPVSKSQAFSCLFGFLFFAFAARAEGQPLLLKEGELNFQTQHLIKVWADPTAKSTFSDAQKRLADGQFVPLDSLPKIGFFERGKYVYWLLLEVENRGRDTFPMLLQLGRLEGDSVWHFSKNRPKTVQIPSKYGKKAPWPSIPFLLIDTWAGEIGPAARDTFLVKHSNFKVNSLTLNVHDARAYAAQKLHHSLRYHWIFVFFFGTVFSVIMYALAMWVATRSAAYGWYAAYCLSIGWTAWVNAEDNLPSLLFVRTWIGWAESKLLFQTLAVGVFYACFIRSLFRGQSAALEKAFRILMAFVLFVGLIEVVLMTRGNAYWNWLHYWWSRQAMLLFLLALVPLIWKIRTRTSRLICFGALSLGGIELLSNLFVSNKWTIQVGSVGVLLDLVFFTVALTMRSKEEFENSQKMSLELQKMQFEQVIELQNVRLRAAQDIHDEIGNRLAKLSLAAQVAARQPDLSEKELRNRLFDLEKEAQRAAGQLREIVFSINPDFDLFDEMQAYFREQASDFWAASSVDLHFDFEKSDTPTVVSPDSKRQLLLLFKEAQTNAAKHAEAKNVWLTFKKTSEKCFVLDVRDDGKGFELDQKNPLSNGLRGMKNRAERIGAAFFIESKKEKGTTVRVEGCL